MKIKIFEAESSDSGSLGPLEAKVNNFLKTINQPHVTAMVIGGEYRRLVIIVSYVDKAGYREKAE